MIISEKKGFTLLEILLAITLLSIVLGAGYSLYFSTLNSLEQAEKNWNMNSELTRAGNYITNELRHAFKVEFNPDNFSPESEKDNYIFTNEKGNIIHRQGLDKDKWKDKVILNSQGNKINFKLFFERVKGENNDYLNNTLKFEIKTLLNNNNESISSKVMAANIPPRNNIIGYNGDSIYYKKEPHSGKIPAAEFETYCFVATAAYDNPLEPVITLLRHFRDYYLVNFPGGRKIIKHYYKISPSLAEKINQSIILMYTARILLYFISGFIILFIFPLKTVPVLFVILYFHCLNKNSNLLEKRCDNNDFLIR